MTNKKPLYQIIVDHYVKRLESNEILPGDQIPTEYELADLFKVSRITVTRAVKELERLGLVSRVKGRGSFVRERQYWGHATQTQNDTVSGVVPIISIIYPHKEQMGFDILRGAQKACHEHGYLLTFTESDYDGERERKCIESAVSSKADGIIILPWSAERIIDLLSELEIRKFPLVVIDRYVEELDVPFVATNNFQGSYDITSHLIKERHHNIAFLCATLKDATSVRERYRGYCRAMVDAGISLRPEYLFEYTSEKILKPWDSPEVHISQMQKLLKGMMEMPNRPTAIVAVNDMIAMFAMRAALTMGISIPGQLSIVGFDNLPICDHLEVPLTTMEQDFFQIGQKAVELIIQSKNGADIEKRNLLDARIVVRQSVAQPAVELTSADQAV